MRIVSKIHDSVVVELSIDEVTVLAASLGTETDADTYEDIEQEYGYERRAEIEDLPLVDGETLPYRMYDVLSNIVEEA
jgi:hypothetical protein